MSGRANHLFCTLLIGLVAGAVLAPAAWGSADWTDPVTVADFTTQANQPALAVDPNGNAIAVWVGNDRLGRGVQTSFRPAGGSWSPVEMLSARVDPQHANDLQPKVAIGGDGMSVAVWSFFDGSKRRIQAASRPLGGSWSAPAYLSDVGPFHSTDPRIAIGSGGFAVAGWGSTTSGSDSWVQAAVRGANGSWSAPETLSASGAYAAVPSVAAGANNDAVVTWQQQGPRVTAEAVVRPAGGSWSAPSTLSPANQDALPSGAAIDAAGNATVIWGGSGSGQIVASRRPAGGSWGTDEVLSPNPGSVVVASSRSGYIVVGSSNVVRVRPPGGPWGPWETASFHGGGAMSLSLGESGDVVVLTACPDRGCQLWAAVRPAGGSWRDWMEAPVGGVANPNMMLSGVDRDGRAVALWGPWVAEGATPKLLAADYAEPASTVPLPDRGGQGMPPPAAGGGQRTSDTNPSALVLVAAARQRVLDQGGVILFGVCEEACTLRASGTVSAPVSTSRVLRFKPVSRAGPPNTRIKLRLQLSRQALRGVKRALSRRKKLIARIALRVTDQSGNARLVKRKIKLAR